MFSQYRISWYISLPIWIHSVMVDMTDNCPFDCQFKHLHLWRMLHLDRQKNSSCSDQDRVLKECIWEMGFKKQDENSFFAIVYDYFFFFSKWSMRQVLHSPLFMGFWIHKFSNSPVYTFSTLFYAKIMYFYMKLLKAINAILLPL